jgi:hypothetical protein
MRIAFWVYGLLYVLVEVIGHGLETVGWVHLTPLDVAQAVTDAVLVVTVVLAVLVAAQLGAERWRRSMAAWQAERADEAETLLDDVAPSPLITVTSWRPEPLALPAGPTPAPRYPAPAGPLDGGPPYR